MPRKKPGAISKPAGRPSKFTQQIADHICEQIMEGRDVTEICANDPGMPSRATVYRWTVAHPDFAVQCARAREACADLELFRMKQIAENCTEENVNSTRVKLNHMQWRVMKIAPRIYSDRVTTQVTGHDGGPVQITQTTIDVRQLGPDARDAFKQALMQAKTIEHDPDEFEED